MNKNYHPYIKCERNGRTEEFIGEACDLSVAYDEAKRLKSEYRPLEAGIKVTEKPVFKIISWSEGKYYRSEGAYLYMLTV